MSIYKKMSLTRMLLIPLLLGACAVAPAAAPNNGDPAPTAAATTITAKPSEPTATSTAIAMATPTAAPEAQPTETRELQIQPAQIEGLDVQVLKSLPVQVKATLNGTLGDGCTSLNAINQKRNGNTFVIEVTTKRPKAAMCTMIAKLFNETVTLDVAGLKAGPYMVSAGTFSQTFTLAADN